MSLPTVVGIAIIKPIMLIGFALLFAIAHTLIKHYAPPWLQKILLRKLW